MFCVEANHMEIFYLNKRGFLGGFFQLPNKASFNECVEVKEILLKDGDSLGYWDSSNISRCFCIAKITN